MAPNQTTNDTAMGGTDPSAAMITGSGNSGVAFQGLTMRPRDPSTAVAVSVGVSPALASNPLAQMPPTAVQDLIGSMSRLATKAQDLAIAGAAAENPRDVQFLTTASIKRLDDDLRTVHANAVSAAEDAKDTEGWMRWVRNDNEKNIAELKIMTRTLLEILTPMLDDAQKAKIAEAKAEVKAMRDQMDRGYLGKVTPTAKGQENGGEDSE